MQLISAKTIDRYRSNIISSAREYGYNDSLYKSGNAGLIIGDYGALAKQLFDNDKISEGHYIELMNSIGFGTYNTSDVDEVN